MSFTYTPGEATTLNDIRFLIGDTDPLAMLDLRLEDEEIARIIALRGANVYRAAAAAARQLAGKFGRKPEGTQGNERIVPTDRATHMRRLAKELEALADSGCSPAAGGLSIAQKETSAANTDLPEPAFKRGMLDETCDGTQAQRS
jgi:hypothetical protein